MKNDLPYLFDDPETPYELTQENKPPKVSKGRSKKTDFMYKVGKYQQNTILCEKTPNIGEYTIKLENSSKDVTEIKDDELDGGDFFICNDDILDDFSCEPQKDENEQNRVEEKKQVIKKLTVSVCSKHKKIRKSFSKQFSEGEDSEKKSEEEYSEHQTEGVKDLFFFPNEDQQNDIVESPTNGSPRESKNQEQSENQQQKMIKGIELIQEPLEGNIRVKIINKRQFLTSKLPPGIKLHCKIKRSASFGNFLNPQFDLFLNNGLKHMASAKKFPLKKRQIYKISTEIGIYEEESPSFVGSINTNSIHDNFWFLYPVCYKEQQELSTISESYSCLTTMIFYQKKEKNKERPMRVLLAPQGTVLMSKKSSFLNINEEVRKQISLKLKTKPESKRPKGQSTKNFILFDDEDDYEYLKLEKESDNVFDLYIQHPISPLQAFTIALTRFDAQLS